jgi:dihydrofolate reductase
MAKLRVNCFSISLDGYGAGPDQTLDEPLGRGGEALHDWMTRTRTFKEHIGERGGETGFEDDLTARAFEGVGAWILGRNMFTASRGEWPNDQWKGWWGDEPPYHCDVFVLTHHARSSIPMKGGTTFHFATGEIRDALDRAFASAKGKDVRLGGGVSTVRQYLEARLVDEMHFAISPILLGQGEHLLAGIDLPALGYAITETVNTARATHVMLARR